MVVVSKYFGLNGGYLRVTQETWNNFSWVRAAERATRHFTVWILIGHKFFKTVTFFWRWSTCSHIWYRNTKNFNHSKPIVSFNKVKRIDKNIVYRDVVDYLCFLLLLVSLSLRNSLYQIITCVLKKCLFLLSLWLSATNFPWFWMVVLNLNL